MRNKMNFQVIAAGSAMHRIFTSLQLNVSRRRVVIAFTAILTLLAFLPPAFASLYIDDTTAKILAFDRDDAGWFVWWNTAICSGEQVHEGTVRFDTNPPGTFGMTAHGCEVNNGNWFNAVNDGTYIYYFVNGELVKKAFNALQEAPPVDYSPSTLATLPAGQGTSPLAVHDDYLYWSRYSNNYYWIYRQPLDAGSGPSLLAGGSGSEISKIKVVSYLDSRWPEAPITALIYLEETGSLRLKRIGGDNGSLNLIQHPALNDFAVHSWKKLVLGYTPWNNYIYASIGVTGSVSPSTGPGSLEKVNMETGANYTIYQATGRRQIVSVAADSNEPDVPFSGSGSSNIYIIEAVYECGEFDLFCSNTHNRIYRRNVTSSIIFPWEEPIYLTGHAKNLLSDDDFLYFTNHPETQSYDPNNRDIYRIKTDKPPVSLDLVADGVEIVQNTQNLDGDVPFAAGKKTYVRGYGHLASNTTGISTFSPGADLYVYINGMLTTDSPIRSISKPVLYAGTDLESGRRSLEESWLWELPNNWVQPGYIHAKMVIDPQQSTQETASTENNSVFTQQPVQVDMKGQPCLYYKAVATVGAASYYHQSFSTSIDRRAASLLPVQGFRYYNNSERLRDFYWDLVWEWVPCFPFMCYVGIPVQREDPFDFSTSSEDEVGSEVLDELRAWSFWEGSPDGCSDTHFVGAIPGDIPSYSDGGRFNGIGARDGEDLVVRMEPGNSGRPAWNSPYGGRTLAHELGHNYDRGHIDCGDPDPPLDTPPFPVCAFGSMDGSDPSTHYGFDPISHSIIIPDADNLTGDLMTYSANRWISRFTYNAISSQISSEGYAATASASAFSHPQMLLHGVLDRTTDEVEMPLPFVLTEGMYDASRAAASHDAASGVDQTSPYEIVLLDSSENELGRSKMVLPLVMDGGGNTVHFTQFIDYPETAALFRIVKGDEVLKELQRSISPPVIELLVPVQDSTADTLHVQWTAVDVDSTHLLFTLQYSPDGLGAWKTLRADYPGLAVAVSTRMLAGGAGAKLRLHATDGMNSTMVESAPFSVDSHPPEPGFTGIIDGESLPFGSRIELFGGAYDAEDGPLSHSDLSWVVSGDASLTASGESLHMDSLESGLYQVTLHAVDSDGNSSSEDGSFEIGPLTVGDGTVPVLDGSCGDVGYQGAVKVVVPLRGEGQAEIKLLYADGSLFACFSDLLRGIPGIFGITPVIAGLQVDADGSGGNYGDADDRGFFVDENGVPFQRIGGRSGMQVTTLPAVGSEVRVIRGLRGWSAEFRISDTLLGGWDHEAAVMFVHDALPSSNDDSNWPTDALVGVPGSWAPAMFGLPTVPAENRPPVADAGPDQITSPMSPMTIYLDGRASFDPDHDILSYQWQQTDGPQIPLYDEDQPVARVLLMPEAAQQLYNFKLTVSDEELTSVPDSLTLTVFPVQRQVPPEPDESNLIPPFMLIGDPGNSPDRMTGFGTVNTIFEISTTEVSNVQYAGFLNSVAKDDPQSLFSPLMESDPRGGIVRSGASGSYFYESKPYMAVKPVNFVSWINAARFVNWLENGMPEGEQGQLTTETGTYDLTIQDAAEAAVRGPDSRYAIPEENEWFKAAYYDPVARFYRQYPLRIEGLPKRAAASSSGNVRNPGPGVINFANGALWFGMQGNVISVASTQAKSAYGTYNQGGNVAEWLDNPTERSMRIIRGGHYEANVEEVSSSGRAFHEPDHTSPSVGFRVVRAPCFADLNGDGTVDAEDVSRFSLEYGRTNCGDVDLCKGDFDGDGDVDGVDLAEFSTCLGEIMTHSLKRP